MATFNVNTINMNAQYNEQKPRINTKWSAIKKPETHTTSGDMGKIIPIFCEELAPNQKIRFNHSIGLQFMPFVSNLFHQIDVEVMNFAVPHRLLMENWEAFYTGGKDGKNVLPIPPHNVPEFKSAPPNSTPVKSFLSGTLWDYFGYPIPSKVDSKGNIVDYTVEDFLNYSLSYKNADDNLESALPNCFLQRAYNLIYDEVLRFPDFEDAVGQDNNKVLHAHWNNDYFTRARAYQMRGDVPMIPLSGEINQLAHKINVVNAGVGDDGLATIEHMGTTDDPKIWKFRGSDNTLHTTYSPSFEFDEDKFVIVGTESNPNTGGGSAANVNTTVTIEPHTLDKFGIDMNDFYSSLCLMKYQVNNARIQPRYEDFISARFGKKPDDARMQKPEYLGSHYVPVSVDTVTNTAQEQGEISGQAWSSGSNMITEYEAPEFCIFMSLLIVRPKAVYCTGLQKKWHKKTRFDFVTPEFADLPDDDVKVSELLWGKDYETDNTRLAYQAMYEEYRTNLNRVTGLVRPNLKSNLTSYTLSRWWATNKDAPVLNADFLQCRPDEKRIKLYQNEPMFIVFSRVEQQGAQPLPLVNNPVDLGV